MSNFWSIYIIGITFGVIVGLFVILHFTRKMKGGNGGHNELTGHSYDGIEEYNNPLPRWWLWFFYSTMIFAFGYFAYFPIGNWAGLGEWTSAKRLAQEQAHHDKEFTKLYSNFYEDSLDKLLNDKRAQGIGARIFENNCTICHGVAAKGGYGFPNLTDNDWLYGSSAEQIKTTLSNGRNGVMPAFAEQLGKKGMEEVAEYVVSLSGLPVIENGEATEIDFEKASNGKKIFASICQGCHGVDAKGNQAIGSANLTDGIWLYDNPDLSLRDDVFFTLQYGRKGGMPAWENIIGKERTHLVSAYVYKLSKQTQQDSNNSQ